MCALAGPLLWTGRAAAAGTLEIVRIAVAPAGDEVSLLATVDPPRPTSTFTVSADGAPLPSQAAPIFSDQLALGLVVDAAPASARSLPPTLSGAASFLLQAPVESHVAVVADASPPTVVTPLQRGAADAVAGLETLRARGGQRHTADAIDLALRQLPAARSGAAPEARRAAEPEWTRVLLLCTSAPNAGSLSEVDLAARLDKANAMLAVVFTGDDSRYWSRVTAATGGILVATRPAAAIEAFGHVADVMRARYLVTFATPRQLPARVALRVGTGASAMTANAIVPAPLGTVADRDTATARPDKDPPPDQPIIDWSALTANPAWLLALGTDVLIIVIALWVARRAWRRDPEPAAEPAPQALDNLFDTVPLPPGPAAASLPEPARREPSPVEAGHRIVVASAAPDSSSAGSRAARPLPAQRGPSASSQAIPSVPGTRSDRPTAITEPIPQLGATQRIPSAAALEAHRRARAVGDATRVAAQAALVSRPRQAAR
jgi:hypothetical protein